MKQTKRFGSESDVSLINEDEQTVSSWEHSMQPQVLPTPLGGQQGCSPCYRHHSNEPVGKTHTAGTPSCSKGKELIRANPKVDPDFAGQIPSLPMLSLSLESPTKTNYCALLDWAKKMIREVWLEALWWSKHHVLEPLEIAVGVERWRT